MVQRQTHLSGNVVAFCRYLRQKGFQVGILEEQDALLALALVEPYRTPEQFQLCLQAALCRTQLQLRAFPELYQHYWRELDRAVDSKLVEKEDVEAQTVPVQPQQPNFQALKSWLYGQTQDEEIATAAYSDLHGGGTAEFPDFDEREMKEIFQWVKKLVDKIAQRRSRRFQSTHHKHRIDLPQSIRKNILRQAEIIELAYRRKKKNELKVVVLCDVSRSMALYSRFFIQFMYAFQHLFPKARSFVFSTELKPVSEALSARSLNQSIQRLSDQMDTWSGGTRIGEALQTFMQQYAHKALTNKTLVIILSDGWDTGQPSLIAEQMRLLQRRAMRVLWLNPLAGSPEWSPEVAGMKAALPYIDGLLPFHNVEALRQVVKAFRI